MQDGGDGHEAMAATAATTAELDQLRRRVLNVVGHELRTPITTLRGLVDLLAATDDGEERTRIEEALRRTSARAERLLDDLLVAAGVVTALPAGTVEPTPIAAAVQAAWTDLGQSEPAPVEAEEEEVAGLARPRSVQRIVSLLLDNALKYGLSPPHISVRRVGDSAIVEISNQGEGIDAAELALLFEPFYRGTSAVTRAAGLGLGLPVARALARQHGGDISIDLGPDGSRVVARVVLPAA